MPKIAIIGAGSLVFKDIADHCFEAGHPAKLAGFVCQCGRRLELFQTIDISHRAVNPHCTHCRKEVQIPGRLINRLLGKHTV